MMNVYKLHDVVLGQGIGNMVLNRYWEYGIKGIRNMVLDKWYQ